MNANIEHMLDTGGRSLSAADRRFVSLLFGELEQFQYQAPKDRALMFHPLRGYERYLIHKVTEIFPKLTSFSIGDDATRRTVVCFKSKRKEQQMQFGQTSPEKRPPSRGSTKEPKSARSPSANKSKTLEPSPQRHRRRSSEPNNKARPSKYDTWAGGDPRGKRNRGLNLEGPVVNGEAEYSRSDAEGIKREPRQPHEAKKKYRSRRSRSQPHLNERSRAKHQRPYHDDSSDRQFSDPDTRGRKARTRPSSEINSPEKRFDKHNIKPVNSYESDKPNSKRSLRDSQTSSETDLSAKDIRFGNSDVENDEYPPSYDDMTTNSTKAKSKAKRNMRRIKRTNSTKSMPSLNNSDKRTPASPVYVNSDAAVRREREHATHHHASPVFMRPTKQNLTDTEDGANDSHSRPMSNEISVEVLQPPKGHRKHSSDDSRRSSRHRKPSDNDNRRSSHKISSDDTRHPNTGESSPLDSFSPEVPRKIHSQPSIETVPFELASGLEEQPEVPNANEFAEEPEHLPPFSATTLVNGIEVDKLNKDTQTDLSGSFIQAMMATYNAHLGAFDQVTQPPDSTSTSQPTSLHPFPLPTSSTGTSTPSAASPSSPYEKLGEYMYKAMLNFQNMLIGGGALPPSHDFRPSNSTNPYTPPATMFTAAPATVQPLYVPWMGAYYAEPSAARPQNIPYPPPPSSDPCCHMHHHLHQPENVLNKMPPRPQGSLKDLRKEIRLDSMPHDDSGHWQGSNGFRFSDNPERKTSSTEQPTLSFPSRSSKAPDGFDSDVSSEITNPEITVAEGGDGVMVYVRNSSNRSNSSAGASVGENSLLGASGDSFARASPLGDDEISYKKSSPLLSRGKRSKKSSRRSSGEKDVSHPDKFPQPNVQEKPKQDSPKDKKKSSKSLKTEKPDQNSPINTEEEVIFSLASAPIAMLDDDDDLMDGSASGSFASSHSALSAHHDKVSNTSGNHADSTNSLVGEDLAPLVKFDDALEISCQDENAED
ncbi:uncharacterized protein LOC120329589 [Styela clava]